MIPALIRAVLEMEESITYQEINGIGKAEGMVEEARRMILLVGKKRFGRTSRKATRALEAIIDVERLEALGERLLEVNSWDELLAER